MKSVLIKKPDIRNDFPTERKLLLVLAILWLGMQIYLFAALGIKIVYDSRLFIGAAELFVRGERGLFVYRSAYAFYSFLISIFLKTGTGIPGLIAFQVLFSGSATIALYASVRKISGNYFSASATVALWIIWLELQRWNFYVLTESVFLSLLLLLIGTLICLKFKWQWFFLPVLLLILSFTRPNGFLLIPACLIALIVKYSSFDKRLQFSFLAGSVLLFPIWFWLADKLLVNMGGQSIVREYPLGYIIQGYKELIVKPEVPLTVPEALSPLTGLWEVVRQDWFYFFKVSFLKSFFYLSMTRPYFSTGHNLLNLVLAFFVYGWAIYGWRQLETDVWLKVFTAAFWLIHLGIIVLLAPDWDNRFIAPSLPLVLIFTGIGLGNWLQVNWFRSGNGIEML